MQTLTPKELATIKDALEISQAFKVYGDGREEHQKECANIINKLSSSSSSLSRSIMSYEELSNHVGHKIEINHVFSWQTNNESSLEIRCLEKGCESCEPLLEIDAKLIVIKQSKNTHDPRTCTNSVPCFDCEIMQRKNN